MGFDYNRAKGHGSQDSVWTSYSDLFLGLSIIFLLLYVAGSLKQGTDGIQQHHENLSLKKEIEDLRQQIKVYETLKQDYLNKQASKEEQSSYEELMGQIDLLKAQANEEKEKLQAQAQNNARKEQALNKYQQMVRNIINSNLISKARIKSRDKLIDSKDEELVEKSQEISSLERSVKAKAQALSAGEAKLKSMQDQMVVRIQQLKSAYHAHTITKQKYEEQELQLKSTTEKRLQALAKANAKTKQELKAASEDLQNVAAKLNQAEGVAAREAKSKELAENKVRSLAGQVAVLDRKVKKSQGDLVQAQANLNARKKLATQIKKNFDQYGIKADVDQATGDVMLSFGDQYFDTGSANLKPKMRQILEQAMPAYSASLFDDPKTAEKIQAVEIVGYASPTYKGKYVDPRSKLDVETRKAVEYNLDLSYARARAIFNHVINKQALSFKHQERLLPLVKVTGRSFLAGEKSREPAAAAGTEEFCRVNDCAKLQKVVIKFSLKD